MYAKYTYSAGATAANILADVVLILTGTTDKTTLSASCDQANTEILTTYNVAGWTVHDAVSSTKSVITSAQSDTGSKYLVLDVGASAGFFRAQCCESWNATTHTATNLITQGGNPDVYSQKYNTTLGGKLLISANARKSIILSFQNSAWGSQSNGSWSGTIERERGNLPWDTVGAAYPLAATISGASGFPATNTFAGSGLPRIRDMATLSDITNQQVGLDVALKGPSTTSNGIYGNSKKYDSTNALAYLVVPIYLQHNSPFFLGGEISTKNDIWFLQAGFGATEDTVVYGGKTMVIFGHSGLSNAYGSLLVPKG